MVNEELDYNVFNSLYEYSQYIRNKKVNYKLSKVFKILDNYPHLIEDIYFELERLKLDTNINNTTFEYYCFWQEILKGKYDLNGNYYKYGRKGIIHIPVSELKQILYNDEHKVSFWLKKNCSFMFVILRLRDYSNYQSMIGFNKKNISENYSKTIGFKDNEIIYKEGELNEELEKE